MSPLMRGGNTQGRNALLRVVFFNSQFTAFKNVVKHGWSFVFDILPKQEQAIFTQSTLRCHLHLASVLSQIALQVFQHLAASSLELVQVVQCIFRSAHVLGQFCLQYPQGKWYHGPYRGSARKSSTPFKWMKQWNSDETAALHLWDIRFIPDPWTSESSCTTQ